MRALVVAVALVAAAPVHAQKKRLPRPPLAGARLSKEGQKRLPPPDDPYLNEGAQGRRNATEEAARTTELPNNQWRP
jgi:hypothetical protein